MEWHRRDTDRVAFVRGLLPHAVILDHGGQLPPQSEEAPRETFIIRRPNLTVLVRGLPIVHGQRLIRVAYDEWGWRGWGDNIRELETVLNAATRRVSLGIYRMPDPYLREITVCINGDLNIPTGSKELPERRILLGDLLMVAEHYDTGKAGGVGRLPKGADPEGDLVLRKDGFWQPR